MKCKFIESRGLISFRLKYLNFAVGWYETINIEARVLDIGCDLIIGLPTIKANDLVTIFAHLLSAADRSHAINLANKHNTQDTTQSISPRSVLSMLVSEMRHNDRIQMEEILTPEQEFVDEFDDDLPTAPCWNELIPWCNNNHEDELDLVTLVGSDEFKARLRALLEKYGKVFSMRLREEPALLEPMSIDLMLSNGRYQQTNEVLGC